MSFLIVGAAVMIGAGVAKAISGGKQKRAAEKERKKAKAEMDARKEQFEQLDTSNPFANMENKMEDLTVNQGEADFMKQQQQESQANIMQQMKGAAGGSGIAALAQTMANQGSMDAQKASISIGKQEASNQMAERTAATAIQGQERQGEIMSRDMERNKVSTLMGMSAADVESAEMKKQAADKKMWAGISSAASAVGGLGGAGGMAGGMAGGVGGGATSMPSMGAQQLPVAGTSIPNQLPAGMTYEQMMAQQNASDRRLKKNINKIGESPNGLNIYSFEFKDSKYGEGLFQGVMSDEIPQDAVVTKNGYDTVDYNKLDVEFKQI